MTMVTTATDAKNGKRAPSSPDDPRCYSRRRWSYFGALQLILVAINLLLHATMLLHDDSSTTTSTSVTDNGSMMHGPTMGLRKGAAAVANSRRLYEQETPLQPKQHKQHKQPTTTSASSQHIIATDGGGNIPPHDQPQQPVAASSQNTATAASSSTSTTTTTNGGGRRDHTIPTFPRWKTGSIDLEAIKSYISLADKHLDRGKDLLCKGSTCSNDMPNVLYLFGSKKSSTISSPSAAAGGGGGHDAEDGDGEGDSSSSSSNRSPRYNYTEYYKNYSSLHHPSEYQVLVEGRRRKTVGIGFADRYPHVEELLVDSLNVLLLANKNDTATTNEKYPRLSNYLNNNQEEHDTAVGIPLILNLGDQQACPSHDKSLLKWNGKSHAIPIFSFAAPTHCDHALLLPHPAIIDTAKTYGSDVSWKRVFDWRRRKYPTSQQARKAIWRGSPNGGKKSVRYDMVLATAAANNKYIQQQQQQHNQSNNNTTTNNNNGLTPQQQLQQQRALKLFDVGYGKVLHKIYPKAPLYAQNVSAKGKVYFEDFNRWRVVLDADGSSWSERMGPLVCLNSILVKMTPRFVDYLWPTLQNGVHYELVQNPVQKWLAPTVEDIIHKTTTNETYLEERLEQAHEWCAEHIVYEKLIEHVLTTLESYVTWLEASDVDWVQKWNSYYHHKMEPKHHQWRALPLEPPQPYFPLRRNSTIFFEHHG